MIFQTSIVDRSELGIEALYPAVIECFSVIILGYIKLRFNQYLINDNGILFSCRYIAGKSGLVSSTETKGLNTFIGSFSLPALVFISGRPQIQ